MFAFCDHPLGIALAEEPFDVMELHREKGYLKADQIDYNSGVVVFKHGCQLITTWAEACLDLNESFRGDQEVLRHLIYERAIELPTLSGNYNARPGSPEMATATIIHWVGVFKRYIRYQMQILDNLFTDLSFK
jgi:hypothetical protein